MAAYLYLMMWQGHSARTMTEQVQLDNTILSACYHRANFFNSVVPDTNFVLMLNRNALRVLLAPATILPPVRAKAKVLELFGLALENYQNTLLWAHFLGMPSLIHELAQQNDLNTHYLEKFSFFTALSNDYTALQAILENMKKLSTGRPQKGKPGAWLDQLIPPPPGFERQITPAEQIEDSIVQSLGFRLPHQLIGSSNFQDQNKLEYQYRPERTLVTYQETTPKHFSLQFEKRRPSMAKTQLSRVFQNNSILRRLLQVSPAISSSGCEIIEEEKGKAYGVKRKLLFKKS